MHAIKQSILRMLYAYGHNGQNFWRKFHYSLNNFSMEFYRKLPDSLLGSRKPYMVHTRSIYNLVDTLPYNFGHPLETFMFWAGFIYLFIYIWPVAPIGFPLSNLIVGPSPSSCRHFLFIYIVAPLSLSTFWKHQWSGPDHSQSL